MPRLHPRSGFTPRLMGRGMTVVAALCRACKGAIFTTLFGVAAIRAADSSVDVCVYGATPAGIVAAVTARQEGRSVVLIEPSRWLGGILGAGLKPMQDCPEPRAVGGLTKSAVFTLGEDPATIRAAFAEWLKREGV